MPAVQVSSSVKRQPKALVWLVALVIVIVLIVVDLTTVFGGNIRFYSEWIRCGQKPYIEGGLPGGGVSSYEQPSTVGIFRGVNTTYYCTALDAERAGLSADPHVYIYPELDELRQAE